MKNKYLTFLSFLFLISPALSAARGTLDSIYNSLVAYYPLDGHVQEVLHNRYESPKSGTINFGPGHMNQSFALKTDSSYIVIPHEYSTLKDGSSMSLWFKVDSFVTQHGQIIDKSDRSDYSVNVSPDQSLNINYRFDEKEVSETKIKIESDQWYFLCLSIDKGILKIYLNGVNVALEAVPNPRVRINPAILGAGGTPYAQGYQFYGSIDELCFFSRALSADQVKILMAEGIKLNEELIKLSRLSRNEAYFDSLNKRHIRFLTQIYNIKNNIRNESDRSKFWKWVNYQLIQNDFKPGKEMRQYKVPRALAIVDKPKTNIPLWLIIIFSFMVVLLVFALIMWQRRKYRIPENHSQENGSSDDETEKTLSQFAVMVSEKNKFIQQIAEGLSAASKKKDYHSLKEELQLIESKIKQSALFTKEAKAIDETASRYNEALAIKLKNEFPRLTSNDLRLIQLLKVGMSSKEISLALGISPQSVDTGRHRLRKKLQLGREESLTNFLNNY